MTKLAADHAVLASNMLAEARLTGTTIDSLGESAPESAAQAEAISDLFAASIHAPVVGWKIGCTTPHAQQALGCDEPFGGRVFADRLYAESAPASLFAYALVECELAFVLGADLAVRRQPYDDVDEVRAATLGVAPAIEVVASRYTSVGAVDWMSLVADHGANGGACIGPVVPVAQLEDLATVSVTCTIGGVPGGSGSGADVMGDPWLALLWIAEHLRVRGIGLEEGQFVLSGTCTGMDLVKPFQPVVASFSGLGELRFVLDGDQ